MFKIVRTYYGGNQSPPNGHLWSSKRTIKSGLTLEQAQAHCGDPETSSSTCTTAAARRIGRRHGNCEWFDGYEET